MATLTLLDYANTFGDLMAKTNSLVQTNNELYTGNLTKTAGTLYFNGSTFSLQANGKCSFQGEVAVEGLGSFLHVQNNLTIDGQAYYNYKNSGPAITSYGQILANAAGIGLVVSNNSIFSGNVSISKTVSANTVNTENLLVTNNAAFSATTNGPILSITQLGSGAALIVNDESNDTTPFLVDNVGNVAIGTNSASGYKLNVNGDSNFTGTLNAANVTVTGTYTLNGSTVYSGNNFTINTNNPGSNSYFNVYRQSSTNASIRWNEPSKVWDILDVTSGIYNKILTANLINDTVTSSSTSLIATANAAKTAYDFAKNSTILIGNTTIRLGSTNTTFTGLSSVSSNTFISSNNCIFSANNTGSAVTISQAGTGNALVINDQSGTDITPFLVDNSGNVAIGANTASGYKLKVVGNTSLIGTTNVSGNLSVTGTITSNQITELTTQAKSSWGHLGLLDNYGYIYNLPITISGINNANTMAYCPYNNSLYVTSSFSTNTVIVVSATTNSIVANIALSEPSYGIAYSFLDNTMWVTTTNKIYFINVVSNSVTSINKTTNGGRIAYDPINDEMYCVNKSGTSIYIYDRSTKTLSRTITTTLTSGINDIIYVPSLAKCIISGLSGVAYKLNVIPNDLSAVPAPVALPTGATFSYGLAYDPYNGWVTVACDNCTAKFISPYTAVPTKMTASGIPYYCVAYNPNNNNNYYCDSAISSPIYIETNNPNVSNFSVSFSGSPYAIDYFTYCPSNKLMYGLSIQLNKIFVFT